MRTSRAGEAAFVGRARLVASVKASVDSGLHVWLKGEPGVGKTALARRAAPDAFYVEHCTPVKELLVSLLLELYAQGLYLLADDGKDDGADDEESLRRKFKRLDSRASLKAICDGLKSAEADSGLRPVVIFDEFETATTLRAIRQIASVAAIICCAPEAKPAQRPFLTTCLRVEVPRLSKSESEKLIEKLLDDYADDIEARERPRLLRQIVEQSDGMPSIARELVKRAAARGDLSLSAVRREDLHGAKPLDLTLPAASSGDSRFTEPRPTRPKSRQVLSALHEQKRCVPPLKCSALHSRPDHAWRHTRTPTPAHQAATRLARLRTRYTFCCWERSGRWRPTLCHNARTCNSAARETDRSWHRSKNARVCGF